MQDTRKRWSGGSELLLSPLERFGFWAIPGLFRQDHGAAVEVDQVSLSLYAVIKACADPPSQVGGWCDQVAIHGPMMSLAQGHTIAGVIVAGCGGRCVKWALHKPFHQNHNILCYWLLLVYISWFACDQDRCQSNDGQMMVKCPTLLSLRRAKILRHTSVVTSEWTAAIS